MRNLINTSATLMSRFSALLLAGLLLGGCAQVTDGPGNDSDASDLAEPVACESHAADAFDAMDEPCAVEGETCTLWGDEVNTAELVCADGIWTYRLHSNTQGNPCPEELPEEGASCWTGKASQLGPLVCEFGDITAVCPPSGGSWTYE